MNKINLREKLSLINDHWNPRIAAELNGQYVKLVKFQGPFTWHHHELEDELFLVVKGRFRMEYRDDDGEKSLWIEEGEMIVVPRGVEHRPVAEDECEVLLFEPVATLNTGNTDNELTRKVLSHI
jgi:mannose-6-phosphate isomerase-like protein (cupin superfamily)